MSIKAFRTVSRFSSFKGLTQVYLVEASITPNKYLRFLFLEGNDSL